jgi:signal peptidase I
LNLDEEKQQQVVEQIRRKHVEAAIASALLPGAGQWLLRDYRAAYIFLALFLVPFLFFRMAMVSPHPLLRAVCTLLPLIVAIVSVKHALRGESAAAPARPSRAWYLLALPILVVANGLYFGFAKRAAGFKTYVEFRNDMRPTLHRGDRYVVDRRAYLHASPKRGDIVAFSNSEDGHEGESGLFASTERVVAIAGDTIARSDRTLLVNGVPYPRKTPNANLQLLDHEPMTVPDGYFFAVGDNPNQPDANEFLLTPISEKNLVGKALYISGSRYDRLRHLRHENLQLPASFRN